MQNTAEKTQGRVYQNPLDSDSRYQSRLHSQVHDRRRLVIGTLRRHAGVLYNPDDPDEHTPQLKIANKLESCGRGASLWWNESESRIVPTHAMCKSRLCPTCSKNRAKRLAARLTAMVALMDSPRMLTLTLKHHDEPLATSLAKLTKLFRRLRQRKQWKKHIAGGVTCTEVTFDPSTKQWHCHVHALVDGVFWKQADISQLWEEITTDSSIVHIKAIHGSRSAVRYLTSYVGKSITPPAATGEHLVEWCTATARLRFMQPFGTLFGVPDPNADVEKVSLDEHLCSTNKIIVAADNGDGGASDLLNELAELVRHRVPDGDAKDLEQTKARHRDVAGRIRAWCSHEENRDDCNTPRVDPPNARSRLPDHRSQWLWEDPDASLAHPDTWRPA